MSTTKRGRWNPYRRVSLFEHPHEFCDYLILIWILIQIPGRVGRIQAFQTNARVLKSFFADHLFAEISFHSVLIFISQFGIAHEHETSIPGAHNSASKHAQAAVRDPRFHGLASDTRNEHILVER